MCMENHGGMVSKGRLLIRVRVLQEESSSSKVGGY
jgi:hypothetical protein